MSLMAFQNLYHGSLDAASNFGREALNIARSLGDRLLEVTATTHLAQVQIFRGEYLESVALLEQHVSLPEDLRSQRLGGPGGPLIQQAVLSTLGDFLSVLGRFDEAVRHAEAALCVAEANDSTWSLCWALNALGFIHLRRGDLSRAIPMFERGLELSRTREMITWTPMLMSNLGISYIHARRSAEGLPLLSTGLNGLREQQRRYILLSVLSAAASACFQAGCLAEATSHAMEALELARQQGAWGLEVFILRVMGDITSTDREAAENYYREALGRATKLGTRYLIPHCHASLGRLLRRTGNRHEAQTHLTVALSMYREMGMSFWLEQAEAEMKELS